MNNKEKKENIVITVVTVCFNAEQCIEGTIQSVLQQSYKNIEYIIKDGLSRDKTEEKIKKYMVDYPIQYISSKDDGIYDAMNQAAELAVGQYVIFLNAGDLFASEKVVTQIVEQIKKNHYPDLIYGDGIFVSPNNVVLKQTMSKLATHKLWYILGGSICHQCIFAKANLLKEFPFLLEYSICADREWMIQMLEKGKRFIHTNVEVARCLEDGYSLQNITKYEQETRTYIQKHFPILKYVWYLLENVKRDKRISICLSALWKKMHS